MGKSKNKKLEEVIRLAYKHWKSKQPKTKGPCPDEETLACFIDGVLKRKEREKVQSHIIRCDRCMDVVAIAMQPVKRAFPRRA